MWSPTQYRRLVRASAWYDLIVTAAFATPWTFAAVHDVLLSITQALDLPGELPVFAPMHVLMANLLGSIVCVWAVVRIRDPQPIYGRYDAAGRFLFATWQLYALLQGASALLWVFLFFEGAWGVLQVLPIRGNWLKNEQVPGAHAIPDAAGPMNGLSTACSTVIVRKRDTRA
ncbi:MULTISPECIES: hypothetical protein [Pseudomonas]|uniref:hypothetical protein n=1 Tax=Pseudomonas TaxID=286 RepID=UPI001E4B88A8|nr:MULTISPECIES: hypothetical protein [Pseudomonas]MCD4529773.1 hypothetical protein [Pseudomonas sp. C3-2018]